MKCKGFLLLSFSTLAFWGCDAKPQETRNKTQNHYTNTNEACKGLSSEDQAFAAKLKPSNRNLYCKEFTAQEREKAKMLSGQDDFDHGRRRKISPDGAVERLARKKTSQGSYRGSCRASKN